MKKNFFIITTVPDSFIFFKGQIQTLKQNFNIQMVSSSGKLFEEFCSSENVIGHKLEMRREISFFKDIKSLINMLFLFYKHKPTYIHGSTPKAALISMIAGSLLRIPYRIYYIHGLRYQGESGLKRSILLFMEKISCYLATNIFVVSHGIKKIIYDDKITNKKVNIIHYGSINGIDYEYFSKSNKNIKSIKEDFNFLGGEFIFGFIGRLVSDKGINELVASFIKINKIHNHTKLLLVGPYEELLDPLHPNTVNEINHHPDIIRIDFQTDVRPFYNLIDVFVFPSFREGFGVSLIEALAMKLPVIASDISGCNEIISHNVNGVLVKKKSINALFLSMNDSIIEPERFSEYANAGRETVVKKYSQNAVWRSTLKAYKNLN
ncbi:glycosyltransferase family 4 protein [Gammaproteobacteria bacterium]|jgi:glycosyltransferase involved in cell wall biosynthesis|nr:glycosyltransferase family 4 protein [Gammaproteobacteria bacterium]